MMTRKDYDRAVAIVHGDTRLAVARVADACTTALGWLDVEELLARDRRAQAEREAFKP